MRMDCPQIGDKSRTAHNVQDAATIHDMGKNVPRIYALLFYLIQELVIVIWILRWFNLPRSELVKPWLVQLATWEKRKFNEMVKACPMEMNGQRLI
jgi:hypothetical protein